MRIKLMHLTTFNGKKCVVNIYSITSILEDAHVVCIIYTPNNAIYCEDDFSAIYCKYFNLLEVANELT